jgi:glycosyltransferase involved in cell wall biosynthesis
MIGAKVTTSGTLVKPGTEVPPQPRPRLSVIVPLYNEEESIRPLYAAIVQALGDVGCTFEMVFVDDGSKDNTAEIAREIARIDSRLRLVKFRRNYGQTPAMAAGIEHARGEILVTMDGDLQNDPADIKLLLEQIEAGFDIVVGWRHNRQDKLVTRKIPSRIANLLIGKVTGVPIRDNGCSLKAFRAELIKSIPLYSEMHRFIPAMASIAGPRVAQIRVRHHARRYGQSKYGLSRIYKVLLDLMVIKTVTTFASRPLRWFAMLSAPVMLAGLALLAHELVNLFTAESALSWPLAGTGVIFLASGTILLCSGALAELIYSRGDVRDNEFFRLTQTVRRSHPDAPGCNRDKARPLSTVTTIPS